MISRAPSPALRSFSRLALLLVLALAGAMPAMADDDDDRRDALRSAVERGQIIALSDLRTIVLARTGGRIIDTELDEDDGRLIYEFRVLTTQGRVLDVEIDAATGRILEIDDD